MKKVLVLGVLAVALAIGGFVWTSRKTGRISAAGAARQRRHPSGLTGLRRQRADLRTARRRRRRRQSGTVLARLDTRTLALQAEQAAAQIEVQEQTLRRVRSGPRPQEVEQARSRLAAVQADQSRAQQDLARLQGISGKTQGRGVSRQDLDRAESAVQTTSARADEAARGASTPRGRLARRGHRDRRGAGQGVAGAAGVAPPPDRARRIEGAGRCRGSVAAARTGRHGHAAAAGVRTGADAAKVGAGLRRRA